MFLVFGYSMLLPQRRVQERDRIERPLHSFVGAVQLAYYGLDASSDALDWQRCTWRWSRPCVPGSSRLAPRPPRQPPRGGEAAAGLERDGRGEAASSSRRPPHAWAPRPRKSTGSQPRRATAASSCHKTTRDPHPTPQSLSCADCHGGNGTATTKEEAHPRPRYPGRVATAANPHESYTLLNRERHEWIRFVNPSDLRVAPVVCGRCHRPIVRTCRRAR